MKIDKDKVLSIITIIGFVLLTRLPRTTAFSNFVSNKPVLAGLLGCVFFIFVLYSIFRSIYNNGFRKENIKKLIYWSSLISIIILFVYSIFHFSFNENYFIVLLFIGLLVISYYLTKEIYNDCIKNIGMPIGLFVGCFSLLQIFLFAEKKYSNRYFSEGKIAFQEHNYPEAIENFKIFSNYHNDNDSSYYYIGKSNLKLCKFDEAVSNFKRIKSDNFNYNKDILTELLDYSIKYLSLGEINNWQNIDKKFKDMLLINLKDCELSMDSNNKYISLKKAPYLNERWKEFHNLSVKFACRQIPCEISEKNFLYITFLLMKGDNESEVINKYFGKMVKDEQINKLIVIALKQNWILSLSEYEQNRDELWKEIEEFRIRLKSK